MSKATLAVLLSRLKRFEKPKTHLEQYPTPSEAAATILWDAAQRGLIQGKQVVDLGAGTGILGLGALLLGAKQVTFVEIDQEASNLIEENRQLLTKLTDQEQGTITILTADVLKNPLKLTADLVVSNPPFGTKHKHADTAFLTAACAIAPEVYSFHKTSTDEHLRNAIAKEGFHPIQTFPFTFSLGATMRHHEKKAHPVTITCWHIAKDL